MDRLRRIIQQNDTKAGRIFDYFIQSLIVVSLVSFSIETLPNLRPETRSLLRGIEVLTVTVFTVEYLLRILVAENRLRYVFSFYGLVDLAAILPFYVASGIDLRAVRSFRLLRLFRTLKLVRYSEALRRVHIALLLARAELALFFSVAAIVLFLSAVGIYYFESQVQPRTFGSIFHSLWWAVATLTTVGYGDLYPVTVGGKVFTFFVLMVGLSLIATPAGIIAAALTEARKIMAQDQP